MRNRLLEQVESRKKELVLEYASGEGSESALLSRAMAKHVRAACVLGWLGNFFTETQINKEKNILKIEF